MKNVYRLAAELIDDERQEYSCVAIKMAARQEQSELYSIPEVAAYAKIFELDWYAVNSNWLIARANAEEAKSVRVLLLLLMDALTSDD